MAYSWQQLLYEGLRILPEQAMAWYETPMTEKKRSSQCGNSIDDEADHEDFRAHSHGPVSKALFKDDMLWLGEYSINLINFFN